MMQRILFGLAAAAVLAIAAMPASAEQTFWTIDTGKPPRPVPTSTYPVDLQYYYLYNAPQACIRHHHHELCPTTPPVPPTMSPQLIPNPNYRTHPLARHT